MSLNDGETEYVFHKKRRKSSFPLKLPKSSINGRKPELFGGKISYDTYMQFTENKILKSIKGTVTQVEKALITQANKIL